MYCGNPAVASAKMALINAHVCVIYQKNIEIMKFMVV
jgi:hypothetical protein